MTTMTEPAAEAAIEAPIEASNPTTLTAERKQELEQILTRAANIATSLYGTMFSSNFGSEWHAYLEWVGCMQEHVKMARTALAHGVDFTEASVHTGVELKFEGYQLDYFNEKIGCIFSEQLRVVPAAPASESTLYILGRMRACHGWPEKRFGLKAEVFYAATQESLTGAAIQREIDWLKGAAAGEHGQYWMHKANSARKFFTTQYGIRAHMRSDDGTIKRSWDYQQGDINVPRNDKRYTWVTAWAIDRLIGRTVVSARQRHPEAIVTWDPELHIPDRPVEDEAQAD